MFNTTDQQMSTIKSEILKDKSIKRIIRTYNQHTSNKWLIETTTKELNKAQQHIDLIIDQNSGDLAELQDTDHLPMRINPAINHEYFLIHAK